MSTPHEYDAERTNAWTRDLPQLSPEIREQRDRLQHAYDTGIHLGAINWQNKFGKLAEAARAVIAAGRPHGLHPYQGGDCACDKCQSWDALKTLLEP